MVNPPDTVFGGEEDGVVRQMTIGEFARLSHLSPRALRLYDDLDLLRSARVDARSGYRFYASGQVERGRLVAWLRRVGMPLQQIRAVCELGPDDAAQALRRSVGRELESRDQEKQDGSTAGYDTICTLMRKHLS